MAKAIMRQASAHRRKKETAPLGLSGEIVGIAIKCCRAGANATASITAFAQANRQVRDSAIVRI